MIALQALDTEEHMTQELPKSFYSFDTPTLSSKDQGCHVISNFF